MLQSLRNFHREEGGQSLIEYTLLAIIVCLGAVAGMGTLAQSLNKVFTQVASSLT